MTDPFATPDPQAPQEPTPVYDSANPAGSAPQAPQPNEPAPVLYGESVTFTETSTPAPNPSPAYGAPADPSAAAFSAPAYSAPVDPNTAAFNAPAYGGAPAAADPNAAAFNAPAPAVPAYTAPTYPAPAPVDPTAATYGTPTYEAPTAPPAPAAAPAYGASVANVPPVPAASYTTSTGLPYVGTPSYDQMPPAATPGYAPAQPGMPVGAPYGATATEPPINMPWYGIDFVNAIKRFFTKYATFSGRASRGEFWWVMLFLFPIDGVNFVEGNDVSFLQLGIQQYLHLIRQQCIGFFSHQRAEHFRFGDHQERRQIKLTGISFFQLYVDLFHRTDAKAGDIGHDQIVFLVVKEPPQAIHQIFCDVTDASAGDLCRSTALRG